MDGKSCLNSNHSMILSPSHLFGSYIGEILPELRDNHICCITMEELFDKYLGHQYKIHSRLNELEFMLTSPYRATIRDAICYKGSLEFMNLLDTFIKRYEGEEVKFESIYYAGELLASGIELEKAFKNNPLNLSVGRRLKRMAYSLTWQFKSREEIRLKALRYKVGTNKGFIKREARERLNNDRKETIAQIEKVCTFDYIKLYQSFLKDERIPIKSSVRRHTLKALTQEKLNYEDGMVLLYMKVKLEDEMPYKEVKHLIIDGAEEYCRLQYSIIYEIFKDIQYTILGDINQQIEKSETETFYNEIVQVLQPVQRLKIYSNKVEDCSYEISQFVKRFTSHSSAVTINERHEEAPIISGHENEVQLLSWIKEKIVEYKEQKMDTVCIICKTRKQVNHLHSKLGYEINLFKDSIILLPIYMVKGCKYDAVIVYEANEKMYYDEADRKLLYIACTRAIHRLSLGYTQQISHLLKE